MSAMQKPTTMLTLLTGWMLADMATVVDAQRQGRMCRTEQQQQGKTCQGFCRCECDEYWNQDGGNCPQVCDAIGNRSPVDVIPWCKDYDVIAECDVYGSDWSSSTIESTVGITYMKAFGRDFKMNLLSDASRAGEELPLAVHIHGGGFNSGSRNNCKVTEAAMHFASRGYRTIVIDYPMCGAYWSYVDPSEDVPLFGTGLFGTGEGGWHAWDAEEPLYTGFGQQDSQCDSGAAAGGVHPEQYLQAAEVANRAARYAIQYAHGMAEEWDIDTDRTVLYGNSAGAVSIYETLLFNTTVRFKPEVTGLPVEPELDAVKIDVASGRAGGMSIPPEVRAVTQETVDAMSPTAALYDLHGSEDKVVPLAAAEALLDRVEPFGIPAELNVVEGLPHGLELFLWQFDKDYPERLDQMFDYIEDNLP